MTTIAEAPPARKGLCSLTLSIDGRTYKLRPAPPLTKNSRTWRLTVAAGQTRAGLTYSVCTFNGKVDCSCPDATKIYAACKHMQALRALGLIPKSARPAGQLTWELLHPETARPRRARRVTAPIATPPVPIATSGPDPLARARRRHQPEPTPASAPISPAEELAIAQETAHHTAPTAASFAAGFRTAVAEHAARLAAGGAR